MDHKVNSAVNYISTNHQFMITGGADGFLYREDTGGEPKFRQATLPPLHSTDISQKVLGLGADKTTMVAPIPRAAYFGISSGNLSAVAYWGGNGDFNPPLSKSYAISSASGERKLVVPLTTGSKMWNTGQFRFDGSFSNQPFTVSPFYISDEFEAQV